MKEIKNVSIIGMGALGVMYGSHLAHHMGFDHVTYIMDEKRYEKYKGSTVTCNGEKLSFTCVPASQAVPADLVIVAVKSTGLTEALDTMKNCIGPDTVILSVMNGISSEEIIGERYGAEHMIYAVAQGMDAMKFGAELTYSKMGVLCIGARLESQKEGLDRVCCLFDRTELPYVREKDILHRLWSKFMLNVGVNQTCMVYSCTYGDVWRPGKERDTMIGAMREVIAVANAEGIDLSESDLEEYDRIIRTLRADGTPSMGQDRIARRHSEVEMFAGTVIRRGQKAGIPTPVNQWLYDQVQEIEKSY